MTGTTGAREGTREGVTEGVTEGIRDGVKVGVTDGTMDMDGAAVACTPEKVNLRTLFNSESDTKRLLALSPQIP